MAGERDPDPSANGGRTRSGRGRGKRRRRSADVAASPQEKDRALSIPEMSDLYRKLLGDLTARFGGTLDDANADAIAYAAAELYHRDFEPRLWQEKSAHDLLDLFGIPRAGVFAPYSLSDRLLLFQRRSSQAQYVTRAHEVLTVLGVPRNDETGAEQSLKWRLDHVMASVNGEGTDPEDDDPDDVDDGAEAGDGEVDDKAEDESDDERGDGEGTSEEAAGLGVRATQAGTPSEGNGQARKPVEAGFAPLAAQPTTDSSATSTAPQSAQPEPSPAQLVDAVKALEQAAEIESELATPTGGDGPGGVDLVSLTETLKGIQGEIAAVRDLVEAFEIGLRRQLDELQSRLESGSQPTPLPLPSPPPEPAPLVPRPSDPTHEMPPVPLEALGTSLAGEGEGEAGRGRRGGRRVLLVVLLALLGVLIAGGVAVAVAVGWDAIRPEPAGLLLPLGFVLHP